MSEIGVNRISEAGAALSVAGSISGFGADNADCETTLGCDDVLELSGGFVVQPQNVSTVSRPATYRHVYAQFCRNDPTGDSV